MKPLRLFALLALLLTSQCVYAVAKDSIRLLVAAHPEYLGGTCTPYYYEHQQYTPAPKGYEAFYISHLGRHGSRTHVSQSQVKRVAEALRQCDSARLLTDTGRRLLHDVDTICHVMNCRWGDLTPLGGLQHEQIGNRMVANFPGIFRRADCRIRAVSSVEMRSAMSMSHFVSGMLRRRPELSIDFSSSEAYSNRLLFFHCTEVRALSRDTVWRKVHSDFRNRVVPDRQFTERLFATDDQESLSEIIPSMTSFMYDLYSLAIIMPNTDIDVPLTHYFTPEERFCVWQVENATHYIRKANSPYAKGIGLDAVKPLMQEMLLSADRAAHGNGACDVVLRFAHGENTIPLASMLEFDNLKVMESDLSKLYLRWQDFHANPMAANIQWILYRNRGGRVLIKVLYNEVEKSLPSLDQSMAPYYDWEEFLNYYSAKAAALNDLSAVNNASVEY